MRRLDLGMMPFRTSYIGAAIRGNGHGAFKISPKAARGVYRNLTRMSEFEDICVTQHKDFFIFYRPKKFKFVEEYLDGQRKVLVF